MIALLVISLGMLLGGLVGSIVLLVRSGEIRVGLLTACFGLLGARQAVTLWLCWHSPVASRAAGAAEASMLLASGLALLILVAVWRTLAERDLAESLHWSSMEAVRMLSEVAASPKLDLDEKLDALLKIGIDRFALEIGMVSRVNKERYEVIAIRAPTGFPVARGAVFTLADTYCGSTLASDRPVGIERVADSNWKGHPPRAAFGFGCYLGAAVRVYGEVVGTLSFGGRNSRKSRFTATEKDLLNLMSQWIGTEFERRLAAEEREARAAELPSGPIPPRPRRRDPRIPWSVDVNAAIRRADKKIRSLLRDDVEIEYHLDEGLQPAVTPRFSIGLIVQSMVAKAVEAMPNGGRITVKTENLEFRVGNPDVFPAVAPNHYVTVAVRDTSTALDTENLTQMFESRSAGESLGTGWDLPERIPLAAIYRALQRCGGDFSMEMEAGKGSTLTVFLPRAEMAGDASLHRPARTFAASSPPM